MKHSSTHSGFTLVEMLTVVAIIGVLAALTAGAMVAVRARVQRAAITNEIKQLEIALDKYKAKFGEYPPDGTDANAVKKHLAKAYPHAKNLNVTGLNPGNALVFWLGGPIVSGRPVGFCQDPKDPDLEGSNTTKARYPAFFDFITTQLNIDGKKATYTSKTGGAPYVYFKGKTSGASITYSGTFSYDGENITPYKKGSVFLGERGYQIISPGLDGKYGIGGDINTAVKNANAFDNQASFGDIDDLAD